MDCQLIHKPADSCTPTLRLRPNIEQTKVRLWKRPDGAYVRHPEEIEEDDSTTTGTAVPLDISVADYRVRSKKIEHDHSEKIRVAQQGMTKSEKLDMFTIEAVVVIPPSIDVQLLQSDADEEIKRAIERYFVYCSMYVHSDDQEAAYTNVRE
jgi:hypothetical protein